MVVIICESPEQCACVCHKLGYISHGKFCGARE